MDDETRKMLTALAIDVEGLRARVAALETAEAERAERAEDDRTTAEIERDMLAVELWRALREFGERIASQNRELAAERLNAASRGGGDHA